jgi:hypothetical protein
MFRLTEPSSSQNHSTGIFSECVNYGIPWCTHSLNVPVLWFWSNDGSVSRNMSPNFLILITKIRRVIDEINLLYNPETQRDGCYQSLGFANLHFVLNIPRISRLFNSTIAVQLFNSL